MLIKIYTLESLHHYSLRIVCKFPLIRPLSSSRPIPYQNLYGKPCLSNSWNFPKRIKNVEGNKLHSNIFSIFFPFLHSFSICSKVRGRNFWFELLLFGHFISLNYIRFNSFLLCEKRVVRTKLMPQHKFF